MRGQKDDDSCLYTGVVMHSLNLIFRLVTEESYHQFRDLFFNCLSNCFLNCLFGCPSKAPTNCQIIMIGREMEALAKP